ncbi:sensor histidine kinase [Salipaludibacillus aurantiacus]|uniref:histidine kinase n=1 Tax=Salipaludibacillus aurantiacus TaxID=1601833 RepID=A0A1H9WUU0_9BACI|nr:HAMP domain-containing sensor histidine kinase [Salipaludibacillus aurantiacus]SES37551.1 Signal transduction histidine kinase [Salipaludibacillus aurantiacus]
MKNYLSIQAKAWILFGVSISIVIGLIISITFYLYQDLYLGNETDRLKQQTESLQEAYLNLSEEEFQERIAWTVDESPVQAVVNNDPMMLGAALPLDEPGDELMINQEEREQLLNGNSVTIIRDHKNLNSRILGIAAPVGQEGFLDAIILLYRPVAEVNDAFYQIAPIVAGIGLVFLFILFILMQRVQQQYLAPLVDLEKGAKKLAEGQYETEISLTVKNELSRLANAFQFLASSLAAEDEKKRSFIQNISHELRTPLSYIKGYSELLHEANVNEEPELYKEYSSIIYKEANRMNRLVDQLISLTKLEQVSGESMDLSPLVLSEILNEAAKNTEVKRRNKNQFLQAEIADDLIVAGEEDRLLQVFINLLDNASSYTQEGGNIKIRTFDGKTNAIVEIEDNGAGINKADLPRLTERFYRGEKSRTRGKGGVGIGLSIVSQIIKLHNGTMSFESDPGKGTKVTVSIPLYTDETEN